MKNETKQLIMELQEDIKKDSKFEEWLQLEWKALYNDIMLGTGLYPGFYQQVKDDYKELGGM